MIKMKKNVTPGKTPVEITVSMIDQDLKDGVTKPEMAIKYGIKPWEVDEMFKHEFLKGRRPLRKRTLSFSFVDDISDEPIIDPNQVTLEDAITDAESIAKDVSDQLGVTVEKVTEILSPTDPDETLEAMITDVTLNGKWKAEDSETEEPIELDEDAQDILNEALVTLVNENGETLKEVFDKELEKEKEEELEIDDDTFEL